MISQREKVKQILRFLRGEEVVVDGARVSSNRLHLSINESHIWLFKALLVEAGIEKENIISDCSFFIYEPYKSDLDTFYSRLVPLMRKEKIVEVLR